MTDPLVISLVAAVQEAADASSLTARVAGLGVDEAIGRLSVVLDASRAFAEACKRSDADGIRKTSIVLLHALAAADAPVAAREMDALRGP